MIGLFGDIKVDDLEQWAIIDHPEYPMTTYSLIEYCYHYMYAGMY